MALFSNPPEDEWHPQHHLALVGALLVNEAIGHLRAISKTQISAVVVEP